MLFYHILYNVYNGKNTLRADILIPGAFLLFGIYIIIKDSNNTKKNLLKTIPVCMFFTYFPNLCMVYI